MATGESSYELLEVTVYFTFKLIYSTGNHCAQPIEAAKMIKSLSHPCLQWARSPLQKTNTKMNRKTTTTTNVHMYGCISSIGHWRVIFEWVCSPGTSLWRKYVYCVLCLCKNHISVLKVPLLEHKKKGYFICVIKLTETVDRYSPNSAAQMVWERGILKL